uniref:Uncharacterized protein n=1 Tax=Arion vulgaris TaxID=1028688 RepID=A0A0B7BLI6_9EUPU
MTSNDKNKLVTTDMKFKGSTDDRFASLHRVFPPYVSVSLSRNDTPPAESIVH